MNFKADNNNSHMFFFHTSQLCAGAITYKRRNFPSNLFKGDPVAVLDTMPNLDTQSKYFVRFFRGTFGRGNGKKYLGKVICPSLPSGGGRLRPARVHETRKRGPAKARCRDTRLTLQ